MEKYLELIIYNIRKDTIMKYCKICGYEFTFKDRIKGCFRLHSKHSLECSQCGSFYISEATIYSFLYNFILGFLLSSFIIFVSNKMIYVINNILIFVLLNSLYYITSHKFQKYKLKIK